MAGRSTQSRCRQRVPAWAPREKEAGAKRKRETKKEAAEAVVCSSCWAVHGNTGRVIHLNLM